MLEGVEWIQAIILGLVQGLTEFLPISSSAHLRIVGQLLPEKADPGAAFTAITQLGTETAVLLYFWRDIVRIISAWFGSLTGRVKRSNPDARMGWLIIIGSIPIGILGLVLEDYIDSTFRSLWIVGTMLIVFAVFLGLADRFGKEQRKIKDLTLGHGLVYGCAQALALIPGVRSWRACSWATPVRRRHDTSSCWRCLRCSPRACIRRLKCLPGTRRAATTVFLPPCWQL